jgi:hypothetical protein
MFPIAANRSDEENVTPYVDDVFSTYLYTGTGGDRSFNNGIDLAGKGGLVWIKSRGNTRPNNLFDTANGAGNSLSSNNYAGLVSSPLGITSFNSNGFTIGASGSINESSINFASWTFRKATKFFDIVTWAGNGVNGRQIPHSLGVAPGMIIVKVTTGIHAGAVSSAVYHRSLGGTKRLTLESDGAAITSATGEPWNSTDPTSTTFTVNSDAKVNAIDDTYVAYLYAHDPSSTGIIQCGSYTTTSGTVNVNLGWEPQFLLIKNSTEAGNWEIKDSMRGVFAGNSASPRLFPNLLNAENSGSNPSFTATGFSVPNGVYNSGTSTITYMAIRRPNKPPTTGTQVFSPVVTPYETNFSVGFATDLAFQKELPSNYNTNWGDRLRGKNRLLGSYNDAAETTYADAISFDTDTNYLKSLLPDSSNNSVFECFRRAPGFFDIVCWTGVAGATNQRVNHNLGVVPEFIIYKGRNKVNYWRVYYGNINQYIPLHLNYAAYTGSNLWGTSLPTVTDFGINCSSMDLDNFDAVAYLFTTLAGVSKVGSYTGNGTSQNIECGFASGARFVLIKRTDSTGEWYLWDTARGIVSGNDGHISLGLGAEITTDDSIDPYSPGFTVNQVAATDINVTSATYIFLAIS